MNKHVGNSELENGGKANKPQNRENNAFYEEFFNEIFKKGGSELSDEEEEEFIEGAYLRFLERIKNLRQQD
jgi:hypothetical protein